MLPVSHKIIFQLKLENVIWKKATKIKCNKYEGCKASMTRLYPNKTSPQIHFATVGQQKLATAVEPSYRSKTEAAKNYQRNSSW